jgi:hypothetical protein
MASLDSVRQKIVWAEHHREALTTEGNRYIATEPCIVVTDEEPETSRIILRVRINSPVPPSIPLIIGDCLQNLRSALDYLIWELVLAANNTPTKDHMFPICSTENAFEQQLSRGRLRGICSDAIAEIKSLQPYITRQDPSAFTVLETLCNLNKHRRLLLTVLSPHSARTEFRSSASIQIVDATGGHNAEVGVGPRPTRVGEIVEVEGKLLFFITFNEGAEKGVEIGSCLHALIEFVRDFVIPKFERFF